MMTEAFRWMNVAPVASLFDNSSFPVTRDKEICQSHVIMR